MSSVEKRGTKQDNICVIKFISFILYFKWNYFNNKLFLVLTTNSIIFVTHSSSLFFFKFFIHFYRCCFWLIFIFFILLNNSLHFYYKSLTSLFFCFFTSPFNILLFTVSYFIFYCYKNLLCSTFFHFHMSSNFDFYAWKKRNEQKKVHSRK